jgi:hypothetical protein
VTRPTTIEQFLEQLERSLRLPGRHKRRVLDEARDHLIEARDRGIAAGLDPWAAEIAAIEAFGDPAVVASRFDPGLLARFSSGVDRFDRWRADHPVAGTAASLAPLALVVAVGWSPFVALAFLPMWAQGVWLGRQLIHRDEAGYRYRLWGWKQEHPVVYQIATLAGPFLGSAVYLQMEKLAGWPHPTAWIFLLVPLFPLGWLLNGPREPESPPASTA